MRKTSLFSLAPIFIFFIVLLMPRESLAIPSFSRQMNTSCFTCHYQHIPKLNAFGREFKLSGYTDVSGELIEDDNLSIPLLSRVSFVLKAKYAKTKSTSSGAVDSGSDRGEWQLPDEAALWLAGRAANNVGFAIEFPGGWAAGKVVFTAPVGNTQVGLSIYSTDALGPAYGMELFNTGILRSIRSLENRKGAIIAQKTGVGAGKATGFTAYVGHEMFFAGLGLWAPSFKSNDGPTDTGSDMSVWYRLAFTPSLGGMDLMVGVFGTTGETKCVDCMGADANGLVQTRKTDSLGVDMQLQTDVGGMSLEVQAMYVSAGDDAPSAANTTNLYKKADGFSAITELGINDTYGLSLAYRNYTDKSGSADLDETATTIGGWINIAENLHVQPQYTMFGKDKDKVGGKDSKFTLMLLAGF